jgi:hypothetical protein
MLAFWREDCRRRHWAIPATGMCTLTVKMMKVHLAFGTKA